MTAIDVKHLKFSYKNKKIFDDISFSVADKKWNSFYGSSRSGKTLISNILCGNVRAFGYININRKYLCDNTISLIKKEVYLISINSILYFAGNTLYDELLLSGASVLDIDEGITFFGLSNYKYKSFKDVPIDKKILVLILQSFLVKSKIVLLDNVLCYLKQEDKDKVYSFMLNNNITVCNFTSNPDELLYSNNVILIDDRFKIVDVTSISEINVINLCIKLKSYGLLDNLYKDIDLIIGDLW